ncbi:MAG: hypothetical protein ACJAR0_001398 [Candidatus Azotimanducaceae bacterium]|jgi:hypothetical protein
MIRQFFLIGLLGILLGGCSDGGGSTATTDVTVTQPDPTTPVSGGGVKGPLVNANASLYLLDAAAADLKGTLISTGSTSTSAALQGITIPAAALDTFLLEITADDDTVDLNSGVAPILTVYRTLVSAQSIRGGQVFATPATTLALALAQQSGPFDSLEVLTTALNISSQQVISTLGFGLAASTDLSTSNPLLTESDTTDEQQARVLAYRLAIEGLAAILDLLATEILAADPSSTITVDDVLAAISEDLSDGAIDGMSASGAIAALTGVTDIGAVVSTDPALLMIPGTSTPITRVADVVVSETDTTGVTVATTGITSGTVAVTARPAKSRPDIDGDGTPDNADAFPSDGNETLDTDGDGTGNNADDDDDGDGASDGDDAFPLLAAESLDTDGDGIGNNTDTDDDGDGTEDSADALPLDATEIVDTDSDGTGNNADTDDDGDGVTDASDRFPVDAAEQADTDGDGVGNNADTDDDGDGVADADDNLPLDARASVATSATIGAGGGSLTSPDGLMTLTFPANALPVDTVISIGSPTVAATAEFDTDKLPVDGHYLLEPDGTQFAVPVEMEWDIPSNSTRPGAIRMVSLLSGGVFTVPGELVVTNPVIGKVTTSIEHFSDLFFVIIGGVVAINQPSTTVGTTLTWNYDFDVQDENFTYDFRTEGAVIFDNSGVAGITKQPELLLGGTVISAPTHDQVIDCEFDKGTNESEDQFICSPSMEGTITATCLTGSAEGLKARMGFNFELSTDNVGVILIPQGRGLLRVEADAFCLDTIEITGPVFISIGNDIDRITEAPESLVLDECGSQSQPYNVVVSNTQTKIVNSAGSCSRELNFTAGDNSIFGALLLVVDAISRLFIYGESGVFIIELIDGVFGQLSDFTSATTDIQFAVNDDGSQVSSQAFSTNNRGQVKLRTLNADGTNSDEEVFSAFGLRTGTFIGYGPSTSKTGLAITSANPSIVYHINHSVDPAVATEIGNVGDTALGISCVRLSCASDTACSVTNSETMGCAVSAFGSEEVYPIFSSDVVTNAATSPTFNFSAPITGIKTASPFVKSNENGQIVIATVNDNEIGKVMLTIRDPAGTEVQTAEFFLTGYEGTTGFIANGSSIVMIDPSAEYPNGALRIGLKNPNGPDDGILTIPATEELLGSSPEPFFGPAFNN